MNEVKLTPAAAFFPMEKARDMQVTALDFITQSVANGFRDIVIAAPTGTGKTALGAAAALWASSFDVVGHQPGGYYLVTQKMLQDQIENDFPRWVPRFRTRGGSIKSATEYPCPRFITCAAASLARDNSQGSQKCALRSQKTCPYTLAKARFQMADVAITNYPYFFTEHMYVKELTPRNLIILDECATVERQITSFVEILIDKETLDAWAPACRPVPRMIDSADFVKWLTERYLTMCSERLGMLNENLVACNYANKKMQDEFSKLKNHVGRVSFAAAELGSHPEDWIYWQEKVDNEWTCTAKSLSAAPFVPILIEEMGAIRLYMSAYPGPKDVFCRTLGLPASKVAWLELDSTFPVENRLIHMTTVGSMSRSYLEETMPRLTAMCQTILEAHATEKGLIHCHTYDLGKRLYEYLRKQPGGQRVLFAAKASERAFQFAQHRKSAEPTVIISPSMTEGYSFDDALARFQIIAKVPYPYLGDRQVAARMERDQDWYTLQAVIAILQACGRIVRSETDHGVTYITDHDFIQLYRENERFFPKWFKNAFKFYR